MVTSPGSADRASAYGLEKVVIDGNDADEVYRTASKFIERAPLATLDQPGLHELIDNIQLHIHHVHNGIAESYFPSGNISGVQRMTSQTQSQTHMASM